MGAVATAYAATRPHASAHGFTDASFQPAFKFENEGHLDAKAAALLATWAAQVGVFSCICVALMSRAALLRHQCLWSDLYDLYSRELSQSVRSSYERFF